MTTSERGTPERYPRAVHTLQFPRAPYCRSEIRQVPPCIHQPAWRASAIAEAPVIEKQDRQAGSAKSFGEGGEAKAPL
jgi:hypothetical protein